MADHNAEFGEVEPCPKSGVPMLRDDGAPDLPGPQWLCEEPTYCGPCGCSENDCFCSRPVATPPTRLDARGGPVMNESSVNQAAENGRPILLTERTEFGGETGAGLMRNRCAFTARDMAADWPEAFTYAVVCGWDRDDEITPEDPDDDAMADLASKFGWDAELVAFLRDAHQQFSALADHTPPASAPKEGPR